MQSVFSKVALLSILLALCVNSQGLPFYFDPLGNTINFTPNSIPDCVLWLDSSNASSITTVGSSVVSWMDMSERKYSAFQSNPALYPSLSNGVIYCVSDTLKITNFISTLSSTIFVSLKINTGSVWILELGPNANFSPGWYMYSPGGDSFKYYDGIGIDGDYGTTLWMPTGRPIWAFIRHGVENGIGSYGVNGENATNKYTHSISENIAITNTLNIGSRNQGSILFSGGIYEIIIYNRCISDEEFNAVSNYLTKRNNGLN